MRLCRFGPENMPQVGFYDERRIVPLKEDAAAFARVTGRTLELPPSAELLAFLPPDGPGFDAARELAAWVESTGNAFPGGSLDPTATPLLVPVARPSKIFLLAGNYADHIREGGGIATERAETFPYVFMKPPTTTLTAAGRPIRLPSVSPGAVDWELELGVVIGRRAKLVGEADALSCVAGY